MPIAILPPDVASKIAAGEVVERPASVVKELVENSLDAGANRIIVDIDGGGTKLIRVADNGHGIPAGEVELAFQRYATSKINDISDLDRITTLGFRGEALPSIASIAEVTLTTRSVDDDNGTAITFRYGRPAEFRSIGSPVGTSVFVRELFRELPGRRKFLKSVHTEMGHVSQIVEHYALAYPEVAFQLSSEGKLVFHTSGQGSVRDVMGILHGYDVADALISVDSRGQTILDDNSVDGVSILEASINGYVSPPHLSRGSRAYISFFVNRRWVRSPMLVTALEEAYRGQLMVDRHPIAVLCLSVPPQELDVNVHPTKREVRFYKEHDIFRLVQQTVWQALKSSAQTPPLDQIDTSSSPIYGSAQPGSLLISKPGNKEDMAIPLTSGNADLISSYSERSDNYSKATTSILRVVGQVADTYIVAEGADGMYLIDQHAAHERVLLERIRAQQSKSEPEAQGLLEPILFQLSPSQTIMIRDHLAVLEEVGFGLEPFGDNAYLLRQVPTVLMGKDLRMSLIDYIAAIQREAGRSDLRDRIAISLACHSAVRAGQVLSLEEMRQLLRQLEEVGNPRTCPHGRPIMLHLSATQLEREFGRR